jgi:hypothetical protein
LTCAPAANFGARYLFAWASRTNGDGRGLSRWRAVSPWGNGGHRAVFSRPLRTAS